MNILNELKDSNIPNNDASNIPIVNKSKNGFINKIDKDEWKREDGQYYHWASDRFLIYPLI